MDVPAALCECWAQGFDARAGTSAGQPTRELVGRVTVVVTGNPVVFFFNAAGAPKQVSQELYMVSACLGVLLQAWLDFDCAVSEVVAAVALSFFYCGLSLSSLVARLIRPSWLRGLGIHETRQHPFSSREVHFAGCRVDPDERTSVPSVFVPLLAHFSFSLSSRPSVPAYLSLRHIWADYPWSSRRAGYSISTSTSIYLGHGPPRGRTAALT